MLTRLRVKGFKNLVDVDVHFGPFTCVVGANGVGKSNLFDAIRFLSALTEKTFLDAARSVRDESGKTGDLRAVFHRVGESHGGELEFEAEMIVPRTGVDELGQVAEAQTTLLRYRLVLRYRSAGPGQLSDGVELVSEELTSVKSEEIDGAVKFPHSKDWFHSAVYHKGRAKFRYYISTREGKAGPVVRLHADDKNHNKSDRPAAQLPRSVLSVTNATESPTAFLARSEMKSWQSLQLEPTALRNADKFVAPTRMSAGGAHMPATLFRLANGAQRGGADGGAVYDQVADRLHRLTPEIRGIEVDRNDTEQLLSVVAVDDRGTRLPARSLSDGTLRFLALAVLLADPDAVGVICFEEPENGIHPARVAAILELLRAIAVDPDLPLGADNPLRQVIVNTHSPEVVDQLDEWEILGALPFGSPAGGVTFAALPGTWREELKPRPALLPLSQLLPFLRPEPDDSEPHDFYPPSRAAVASDGTPARRRIRNRPDVRSLFDLEPAGL